MTELEIKMHILKQITYSGIRDPVIMNLAHMLTYGKTKAIDKATSIYDWVKKNIPYVTEKAGRDIALSPAASLKLATNRLGRAIDCEDHSVLVASLTKLAGLPTRFKVISRDGIKYTHIYPETLVSGRWTPLDTTIPLPFGSEIKFYKAKTYVL